MRNHNTHHAPKSHLTFDHRRIIEQAYNANPLPLPSRPADASCALLHMFLDDEFSLRMLDTAA